MTGFRGQGTCTKQHLYKKQNDGKINNVYNISSRLSYLADLEVSKEILKSNRTISIINEAMAFSVVQLSEKWIISSI